MLAYFIYLELLLSSCINYILLPYVGEEWTSEEWAWHARTGQARRISAATLSEETSA
jgi:hypothetical protein